MNARAALDEWLKSKGYMPIDEGPDWFYQQYQGPGLATTPATPRAQRHCTYLSRRGITCSRPAPVFACSNGVPLTMRASEKELHDLLSDLGDWWREYRNIHGYP